MCLRREPRRLPALLAGALGPLAVQVAYNRAVFGAAAAAGQLATSVAGAVDKTGSAALWRWPAAGAWGLLASPARGILWFSPFFVALPWAWRYRRTLTDPAARQLTALCGTLAIALFAVAASWYD